MSISHHFFVKGSKLFPLADIKGFLTDVKPALLSALDTEYEKNPYEVCCVDDVNSVHYHDFLMLQFCYLLQGASAAPKRMVKASDSSSSVAAGGLDSLPREDISGKITPTLLKSLESPDWKVWLQDLTNSFSFFFSLL